MVQGRVRIKIRTRVRVGVTFNFSIYHWSNPCVKNLPITISHRVFLDNVLNSVRLRNLSYAVTYKYFLMYCFQIKAHQL